MAQQALPQREARLGRPMGAVGHSPDAVVLLLPGGGLHRSARRPSPVAAASVLPLARHLVRSARQERLTAHMVRYRYRGWNGSAAHPAADARWALEEVVRRYGDVPVCLAGVDIGARAALRAAGHPSVAAVIALGPLLPGPGDEPDTDDAPAAAGEPAAAGGPGAAAAGRQEPVEQLAGRSVLLVHGTDDARTDPELSYRLAQRAKKVSADVCRFEVHTEGHGMRGHHTEIAALSRNFVLGSLCGREYARPLVDAMAAPPPLGLRMPLASGFGRTLQY